MPIFVETLIRAPIDEVWRATQDPAAHQRWDLRFSDIEYLPRDGQLAPQRFLYRTRIGFGFQVAGEGESVGNRDGADGSRTSVLRFWSDDRKSLIATGSGYWKYIPAPEGVRFLTLYDYETRFGYPGRLLDRVLFRPLMAWATAWSFDRLRLWIERGASPEETRRLAISEGIARVTLAAIWIYQGLVPKLIAPDRAELEMTGAVVGSTLAPAVLYTLAALEIALGVALLVFRESRVLVLATTAAVVSISIGGIAARPPIAAAAFNPVVLTAAMAALGAILLQSMPSVPRALRTRWSSRGKSE